MINNVVLTGRLTKDIDLRYTSNNIPTTSFTLAVNRTYGGSSGEKSTDFISCVAFRKTAEIMANYLRKGSLVGLQGRIQTRNYQGKDGNTVYVTEVIVENLTFLESKQQDNNNYYNNNNNNNFDFNSFANNTNNNFNNFNNGQNDMFSGLNGSSFMDKLGNDNMFDNIRNPFQD